MTVSFSSLQQDLFYKVASEPYFNGLGGGRNLPVFKVRDQDIVSQLESSLSGFGFPVGALPANVAKPGVPGITIEVLMPGIRKVYSKNLNAPILVPVAKFLIKEDHTVNTGTNQDGIDAEQVAKYLTQTLNVFGITDMGAAFELDDEACVPNPSFHPLICYEVTVVCLWQTEQLTQCLLPQINDEALTVTLSTADGSQIYFTTDQSFPGPFNPAAQVYAAPFAVAGGATVRFAAFLAGRTGSIAGSALIT